MPNDKTTREAVDLAETIIDKALGAPDPRDKDLGCVKPLSKAERDKLEASRLRREEAMRQWRASPEGRRAEAELDAELDAIEAVEARTDRRTDTRPGAQARRAGARTAEHSAKAVRIRVDREARRRAAGLRARKRLQLLP